VHGTRVRSGSFIKGKSGAKGAGTTVVFDMILMEDINESGKISTLQVIGISNSLPPPFVDPPFVSVPDAHTHTHSLSLSAVALAPSQP